MYSKHSIKGTYDKSNTSNKCVQDEFDQVKVHNLFKEEVPFQK